MGNCTVKRGQKVSKTYSSSIKINVPDLFYLSRSEKSLLVVKSSESTQISLNKKLKLFRDSSISLLSDSSLIIAGGSDSSNSLTSRVYQLFPYSRELKSLPALPMPVKFGSFHLYRSSFLIYVGGISESQDNDSSIGEQGSPLCRLDLSENVWHVFTSRSVFDPSKYLKRKVAEEEGKSETLSENYKESTSPSAVWSIKDLHEPGSVIQNETLYLVGGKLWINERLEASEKIFSLQLDQEFFIKEEEFSLPVKLSAPSCAADQKVLFVAGGLREDSSASSEIFIIDCKTKTVKKLDLTIDRPIELRYPIFVQEKGLLCFSPPKMLYLRQDKQQIFVFSLANQVIQAQINVIKTEFQEIECAKQVVDLTLHLLQDKEKDLTVNIKNSDEKLQDFEEKLQNFDEKTEKNEKYSRNKREKRKNTEEAGKVDDFEEFKVNKKYQQEAENEENPESEIKDVIFELPIENPPILDFQQESILCPKCHKNATRVSKTHIFYKSPCNHCKKPHSKEYICESCSSIHCKSCSRKLKVFVRVENSVLTCSSQHSFSVFSDVTSQYPCVNCSRPTTSSHFFCFLCDEHVCSECFEDLQNTIKSNQICQNSHQMTWNSKPNPFCSACFQESSGFGHFSCEKCKICLCLECVKSKNQVRIAITETSVKHKEDLSYNLHINESSLYEEPDKPSILEDNKKSEQFVELGDRDIPDESEVTLKQSSSAFAVSFEEIKKKILQKPLRGEKSPIFLSLSPNKNTEKKRGIASRFFNTPPEATLTRKSLGALPLEKKHKYSSDYFMPPPMNNNFRPLQIFNSNILKETYDLPVSQPSPDTEKLIEVHTQNKYMQESEAFNNSAIDLSYRSDQMNPFLQSIELIKTSKLRESFEVRPDLREKIEKSNRDIKEKVIIEDETSKYLSEKKIVDRESFKGNKKIIKDTKHLDHENLGLLAEKKGSKKGKKESHQITGKITGLIENPKEVNIKSHDEGFDVDFKNKDIEYFKENDKKSKKYASNDNGLNDSSNQHFTLILKPVLFEESKEINSNCSSKLQLISTPLELASKPPNNPNHSFPSNNYEESKHSNISNSLKKIENSKNSSKKSFSLKSKSLSSQEFSIKSIKNQENDSKKSSIKEIAGQINLDLPIFNQTDTGELSVFFQTIGDESEQVAPVIDKNQGKDKLKALKAKLNRLSVKGKNQTSSSGSEQSSKCAGFIYGGGFEITSSSEESSEKSDLKKVKEKLDDSDDYARQKSIKGIKSSSSSEYAFDNPFQVFDASGEVSGIRSYIREKDQISSKGRKNTSKDSKFEKRSDVKNKNSHNHSESKEKSNDCQKNKKNPKKSPKKQKKVEISSSSGSSYGFIPLNFE